MGQKHSVERSEIVPGDHIYADRVGNVFSHHGIYVGENMVVHFTSPAGKSSASSSPPPPADVSSTCPNSPCESGQHPDGGVTLSCLDCFLGGEASLYRYQYEAPRSFRWGIRTTVASDSQEEVMDRAMYLLQRGFGAYHLLKNNCEDFAIYCKTSYLITDNEQVGCSGQVSSWFLRFRDIDQRSDAKKVPVEEVALYR